MTKGFELPSKKEFFSMSLDLYSKADFLRKIEDFLCNDKPDIVIFFTTDMVMENLEGAQNEEDIPEDVVLLPGERALFTKEEIELFEERAVTDFGCLDGFFENGPCTVYLVGDDEKKMRSVMECFPRINKELTVQGAYYVNPSLSEELKLSDKLIVNEINANAPDILIVMMSSSRQGDWIRKNHSILHAKVCLGMGAVADSFIRVHKKPPAIFTTFHLGWLYRKLFCRKNRGEERARRIFYKKLEQYKNKKEP